MTIERLRVAPRMSQVVVHNGTVYLAGQVADDPVPSEGKQTKQILAKIDRLLDEVGSDKSHIIWANIWLADIRAFDEMNAIWDAWVDRANPPARAAVGAPLARPPNLVEIMVVAARRQDG